MKYSHLSLTVIALLIVITSCRKNGPGHPEKNPCTQATSIVYDFSLKNNLPTQLTFDNDGNTYIAADYFGPVDIDPGTGVLNITGSGTYIEKLNPTGAVVWGKQLSNDNTQRIISITIDAAKNTYVTIWGYNISDDTFNLFLSKIDVNGNIIYTKTIESHAGSDSVPRVNIDVSGNIYIMLDNPTSLIKLNPSGDPIWSKQIVGTSAGLGTPNTFTLTGNGSIQIRGEFGNVQDIDPGPGIYNAGTNGVASSFILTLDTAGNFVNGKTIQHITGKKLLDNLYLIGTDTLRKVDANNSIVWQIKIPGGFLAASTDVSGNFYLAGRFAATVNFNPGGKAFNLTARGVTDACIEKVDASGHFVWAVQPNTLSAYISTDQSGSSSIGVDKQLNVYTAGYFGNGSIFYNFISELSQCK